MSWVRRSSSSAPRTAAPDRRHRVAVGGHQIEVVALDGAHDPGPDAAPQQHALVRRLTTASRVEGRPVEHDASLGVDPDDRGVPLAQRRVGELEPVRVPVAVRLVRRCHPVILPDASPAEDPTAGRDRRPTGPTSSPTRIARMSDSPPTITRDDVAKLAHLARIALTDAELDHLAPQLAVILESVAAVSGVAADDIPPSSHALPMENVMRADEVRGGLSPREALLRRARAASSSGSRSRGSWVRSNERPHQDGRRRARGRHLRRTRRARSRSPAPSSPASRRSTLPCTPTCRSTPTARWPRRTPPTPGARPRRRRAARAARACPSRSRTSPPPRVSPPPRARGSSRAGCRRTTPPWSPSCAQPACRSSARPTWTSSPWAARPSTRPTAPPTTRGTSSASRVAPAVARRPPSPATPRRSPSAPTPAARSGSRARSPGTVGVKPTYGGVSRYGLIALASSLDQAGPVARTVLDAALLHDVIGGHDPMDSTSIDMAWPSMAEVGPPGRPDQGLRVGVVTRARRRRLPGRCQQRFEESIALLVDAGAEVVEVSCPHFVYALAAYYLILPSEASSNLARFDAMRYGLRVAPAGVVAPSAEQVMAATREAGFGDEVKRRIILGTFALSSGYYDAYYGQAQKVRTLIGRDFAQAFGRSTCSHHRRRRRPPSRSARSSTTRSRCTSTTSRPSRPTWRACRASRSRAGSRRRTVCRRGSSSWRRRPRMRGSTTLVLRSRRCSRSAGAVRYSAQAPELEVSRMTTTPQTTELMPYDEALARFDPVLGLEVHVELNTASKMFCGCRRRSARAEHPDLPGVPGAPGCAARRQRQGGRVRDPDRARAQLPDRVLVVASPARTTSTRTCRRTSRRHSTTSRSPSTARPRSTWTARSSASRSSGPTWRRTPASRCTWAARPGGSMAPTTRCSTSTAPASR